MQWSGKEAFFFNSGSFFLHGQNLGPVTDPVTSPEMDVKKGHCGIRLSGKLPNQVNFTLDFHDISPRLSKSVLPSQQNELPIGLGETGKS